MGSDPCASPQDHDEATADELPRPIPYEHWMAEMPNLGKWAERFYREYVGISDKEEVIEHLLEIRRLAWEVYQYRCIATFLFVNYNLRDAYGLEWYEGILRRINKDRHVFLDLGCAFGYTARNLVYDGAAKENIISGDLREEFWKLGYQLFRDRDTFQGRFYRGDIFDNRYLAEFDGKIDILHLSAVLHLFDLPCQRTIVSRLSQLVSSKPGSLIFGRQVGNTLPCYSLSPAQPGRGLYQHNEQSFKDLFESVAPGKWDVQAWLTTRKDQMAENGGYRGRLRFIITRLQIPPQQQ